MRVEEALAEAKRRWGPEAAVCSDETGEARCVVGVCADGGFFVCGIGPTWTAAFANADAFERARAATDKGARAAG